MADPSLTAGDSGALNDLLLEALERLEQGGAAALDALFEAHPEQRQALRRRLRHLQELGLVDAALPLTFQSGTAGGRASALGAGPAGGSGPDDHGRLGGYRLHEVLGGGGMGVVYRATDEALGREVALKVIRPEFHFVPGATERFRREVETVARLQHPGIVPVYAVGEDQGVPYFVMERVHGATLDHVLAALAGREPARLTAADLQRAVAGHAGQDEAVLEPGYVFAGTYEEAVLRIVGQVAEALDHAHRRGVLHRDVKPSNVMLTIEGRAMLLDFGLAVAEENVRLTRSGTRLGSLGYMSPEQAESDFDALSARSDVYSLGVTLYELLTLALPHEAPSAHQLIRVICEQRPRALRARNPAVSWEAETVCLTALEADPARRYASARDFARDLGNVLEGRPIEARRAGAWRRLTSWARRRPAEAAAAALLVALVVGVPSALYLQARAHVATLQAEQERTKQERARAERHFGLALDAMNAQLRELALRDLRFVPQLEPVRRRLAEKAVGLMAELGAEAGEDPRLVRSMAATHAGVGSIQFELGDVEAADASYAAQQALLEQEERRAPGDSGVSRGLAEAYRDRALLPLVRGRWQEALQWLERAERAFDALETSGAAGPSERFQHGLALHMRAALLAPRDPAAAEADARRALARYDAAGLSAGDPADDAARHARQRHAATWSVLGTLLTNRRLTGEALAAFDAAASLLEPMAKSPRERPAATSELASVLINRGLTHLWSDRREDADRDLARAAELLEPLARDFPGVPQYRYDLGHALLNRGVVLEELGRLPEAQEATLAALDAYERLHAEFPGNRGYAAAVASGWSNVALKRNLLGRHDEAEEAAEKGVAGYRALLAEDPSNVEYAVYFGAALHNLATAHQKRGFLDRALAVTDEAIGVQEGVLARLEHPVARDFLRNHWSKKSDVLLARGDHAAAVAAGERVAELGVDEGLQWRRAAYQVACAIPIALADDALSPAERAAAAARYRARALELLEEAASRGYRDWRFVEENAAFAPLREDARYAGVLALLKEGAE